MWFMIYWKFQCELGSLSSALFTRAKREKLISTVDFPSYNTITYTCIHSHLVRLIFCFYCLHLYHSYLYLLMFCLLFSLSRGASSNPRFIAIMIMFYWAQFLAKPCGSSLGSWGYLWYEEMWFSVWIVADSAVFMAIRAPHWLTTCTIPHSMNGPGVREMRCGCGWDGYTSQHRHGPSHDDDDLFLLSCAA